MQPLKGQVLLATPAVTNGNDSSTGLNFLGNFLDACTGCHFDMINIHHYVQRSDVNVDQAVSTLKSYIEESVPMLQAKYPQIQNIPMMIGEVSRKIVQSCLIAHICWYSSEGCTDSSLVLALERLSLRRRRLPSENDALPG